MNPKYSTKPVQKALDYFRTAKYNYDSAQSVYAVYYGPLSEKVKTAPIFCGKHGLCGAAYAAVDIKPDIEDIIIQEFQLNAKECTCDEIRYFGKLPCHQCVQLACQILDDYQVPYFVEEEKLWYEGKKDIDKLFQ